MKRADSGVALIAMIILIVVIGILVYSTVSLVANTARNNINDLYRHQAYEAAMAGLMNAAYNALNSGTYTSSEAQVNGIQHYKYSYNIASSAGADNIYIDAGASSQPNNATITGWNIINNSTEAGAITQIQFSWVSPANNLLSVAINGSSVWNGTAATGTVVDITDVNVPASTTVPGNTLVFDGNMSNVSVYATLYFGNGSRITRRIWRVQSPVLPDGGPWYPTNLNSWWKMNEAAGATVNDLINPNGANPPNNGTISGATWTTGKFGGGLSFDGVNDRVDCGTSNSLTNASFSVSAWVYLNSLPAANRYFGIAGRGNNANSAPYALTRGYELFVNSNDDATVANRNKIIWAIGPNGTSNKAVSLSVPSTSTWIHVVGTYGNLDGMYRAKLYIDSSLNSTVNSSYSQNGRFYMGTRNNRANTYLNGLMDEVTFFNRELTQSEVTDIFTPNTGTASGTPTSVKCTGYAKDNSNNVLMRQTFVATFEVSGSSFNITKYNETTEHIIP